MPPVTPEAPYVANPKKPLLRLAILLGALAILAAGAYVFRAGLPSATNEPEIVLTGEEVAERIAAFLDYSVGETTVQFSYECGSQYEGCRRKSPPNEQPYVEQIILAYEALAEVSGHQRYGEKVELLRARVLRACRDDIAFCEWNFGSLHAHYDATGDPAYVNFMKLLDPVLLDEDMSASRAL